MRLMVQTQDRRRTWLVQAAAR